MLHLSKLLETAQAHHKARRLLNQVTQRINEELQGCASMAICLDHLNLVDILKVA